MPGPAGSLRAAFLPATGLASTRVAGLLLAALLIALRVRVPSAHGARQPKPVLHL
jgi:hypothetical protein